MHFICQQVRHNWAATVQIKPWVIEFTGAMQVLGIWLDPTPHWKSHLDAMAGKMKTQLRVLTCLSVSIWGLSLVQAWMLYDMVIWLAMTYGAITWHQPWCQNGLNQGLNEVLAPISELMLLDYNRGLPSHSSIYPRSRDSCTPVKPLSGFHDGPGYPVPGE